MCREIVIFEIFIAWRPFTQHASHIFSYSNCRCRWSCLKVHPEWPRVSTREHESPRVTTSHREWPRVKKRKILGWILWEMLKEQELWGWPTFRKGNYFAVLTTIDSSESSSSPDTWSMGSVSYVCSSHMLLVKMAFLRGKLFLKVSQIWCCWFKNEFIIIGNFLR